MDADLIIYIYLRNAFPSHMCWYLHNSVIFRLLDGSNSLLAPAWAVCQLPMASSSSCLRGWLEDFSQHWGGLAEWCAKKMQDIKKRENYQSCKGHESSKWLQRHITYYIQQNSLRWSSQFGMQEHLICALHTIQKFQEKMAHILLQGQRTFRTSSSTAFVIECGTFRSCWILMNKKTQGQIIKIDAKRPSTIKHSSSFSSYDIVFTKVLPPQLDFLWAFIG